jgi:O-antigen ligase
MLGWAFVCVAWDWDRDQVYLKLIVALPLLSLLVAVPLIPLGWSLFQDTSPPRLQGAQIAATLGGLSVASVTSAIVLWRRAAWRPAIPLGMAAAVCCVTTLGRGAIIAMIMASSPAVVRFLRDRWRRLSAETYLKVFLGTMVVVGAFVLFAVPALNERTENAVSYNTQTKTIEKSAGSGRTQAWKNYYKLAEENLAFGRGMGSGPHIKIADGGFQSQHNEYLRLLLELGYVGGLLVLASMIYVLVRLIKSTPAVVRPESIMLAIALAIYSFTDNTLTARNLAVPILLTLAIAAAPSRRALRGEPPSHAVAAGHP